VDNPYQPPKNVGRQEPIGDERLTIRPRRSFLGYAALSGCGALPRAKKEGRLFCESLADLYNLPRIPKAAAVVSLQLGTAVPLLNRRTRAIRVDDIGFAFIEADKLRFLGDAVSINLPRSDVQSVEASSIWPGQRLRIQLHNEIACQARFTLFESSGFLAGFGQRARAFRESLTRWFSQAT
jgi:hypothetical protein